MRIFVTGATGFIGSAFIRLAAKSGHEIVALKRTGSSVDFGQQENIRWVVAALDDISPLDLNGCDALLHFAAHGVKPADANWQDCFYWNVTAALNLWLQAANAGIRRFVICGSGGEYGKSGERYPYLSTSSPLLPTGPYGASKAAASMAAAGFAIERNVELAILRPFQVYGEGEAMDRFWPSLRCAALEGADFPMTTGEQIRDFVPVEQVAACFLTAMTRSDLLPGEPLIENVGTGNPRTLLEFAKSEWKRWGATGRLLPGVLPQRSGEVMRYIPEI